jgi:protein gp37
MKQAHRFSGAGQPYEGLTQLTKNGPVWTGAARFAPEMLDAPLKWRQPKRIFVNSMSDLFHEDVTFYQIAAVFGVMAACRQHTFQVLTKRPERMRVWFEWLDVLAESVKAKYPHEPIEGRYAEALISAGVKVSDMPNAVPASWPLPNVWLGVSAENQEAADERIPLLQHCPAALRFVSAEPLLGSLYITWRLKRTPESGGLPPIDWVIAGGESGPGARPCALEWIEGLVGQCRDHDVPVFVKQLGATVVSTQRTTAGGDWAWYAGLAERKGGNPSEWPVHLNVREFPEVRRAG